MRIETTTRTLYTFDELSDSAKETAREWYRRAQDGDTFWSESVITGAQEAGELLGITFDKARGRRSEPAIYWSGFNSQGDGACFEGSWSAADVKPGKVAANWTGDGKSNGELRRIAAEFERIARAYPGASFTVTHRGHYSHEMCTAFECDPGEFIPADQHDGETAEQYTDAQNAAEQEWQKAFPEADLIEATRDFMRWIYSSLEDEYDYQNSDAQVDDALRANEYEFTEDGSLA